MNDGYEIYYDHQIYIGKHTYFSSPPTRLEYNDVNSKVRIGHYTSVAQDVIFQAGGNHNTHFATTYPLITRLMPNRPPLSEMPIVDDDIVIGSDVWICRDVKIMGPLKIGHGAILAAHSVVTKDVPPYAIVAGNPARIKKFRFDQEIIDKLLEIAWWNWSDEEVLERADDLVGLDINYFVEKYKEKK